VVSPSPEGTKREILEVLRTTPSTVSQLCEELKLSQTPVREHLYGLKSMGLVEETKKRDGPGRPTKVYRLTREAEDVFPKKYAQLASIAVDVLRKHLDEETLRRELHDRLLKELSRHAELLDGLKDLGTYPTVERAEDGSRTITFHQCPFLDVAEEDDLLCDVDRIVLESLEDTEVNVESTIVRGGDCCVFHLE